MLLLMFHIRNITVSTEVYSSPTGTFNFSPIVFFKKKKTFNIHQSQCQRVYGMYNSIHFGSVEDKSTTILSDMLAIFLIRNITVSVAVYFSPTSGFLVLAYKIVEKHTSYNTKSYNTKTYIYFSPICYQCFIFLPDRWIHSLNIYYNTNKHIYLSPICY